MCIDYQSIGPEATRCAGKPDDSPVPGGNTAAMTTAMPWPELDVINTRRCRLEPLVPAHAEVMVPVLSASELYVFTGVTPPTLDQLSARYRAQSRGGSSDGRQWWCNWIVLTADSGTTPAGDVQPIGYVQATVQAVDASASAPPDRAPGGGGPAIGGPGRPEPGNR